MYARSIGQWLHLMTHLGWVVVHVSCGVSVAIAPFGSYGFLLDLSHLAIALLIQLLYLSMRDACRLSFFSRL